MLDVNSKIKIQDEGSWILANGAGNQDYGIKSMGSGNFCEWAEFARFSDTKGAVIRANSIFQQTFNSMSNAGTQDLLSVSLGEACTHYLILSSVCVNLDEDQTQFPYNIRMFLDIEIGGINLNGYQAIVFSKDTEYVSYAGLQQSICFSGVKSFPKPADRIAKMKIKSFEGPHARVSPIDGNIALFGFSYPEDYR